MKHARRRLTDGRPIPATVHRGQRKTGTNPRAKKTNPRRLGTNPSASETADVARVGRLRRRALARFRVSTGAAWCELCDDTGFISDRTNGDDYRPPTFYPCPDHRQITANEAADILEGGRPGHET